MDNPYHKPAGHYDNRRETPLSEYTVGERFALMFGHIAPKTTPMTTPLEEAGYALPPYNPINSVAQLQADLETAIDSYVENQPLFEHLHATQGLKVDIRPEGLILHPAGDPRHIMLALVCESDIQFRRSLDSSGGTYSWESELSGAPIFIRANEVVDHTGTLVPAFPPVIPGTEPTAP